MPKSTVVITGLGVVSSIGVGGDAYFDALMNQKSGITSLADRTDEGAKPPADWNFDAPTGEMAQHAGLWIGAPITDFDAKQYVRPRKALKVMCREIQTCFAASQMAIEDAGLAAFFPAGETESLLAGDSEPIQPAEIGTVFGSEMFYGPASEMEDAMRLCMDEAGNFDSSKFGAAAMKQVLPLWMLKYLPNMPACHVGISLGAHGPNNTLVLGDVSGPAAMIEAEGCLRRSIARFMIAGGVGTRINTTRMNYRGDLPIAEVADPIGLSSRPYDGASRGVVGGEAATSFVLEHAESASRRGAAVIARVVSHASRFIASDGMQLAMRTSSNDQATARGSAAAIASAIRGALESAELAPSDIALLVGHGSGDPVMDAAEQQAIESTLPGVAVIAPAASVGHTGAASGTVGIATGALVIKNRTIPPTIGLTDAKTRVAVVREAQPLAGDYVLCLSHTSEGSAIAVILGT
ncbi:3-oxoacyl-[acyl-carrier-protein] synthase 2 [Rubripirellula tenax]|uniref:3-oxoacyl-[acyl-carrier-protein] synthase 2 n=1 Tax=Rubripirellula tenax TaxID=2528015 RepID=A0A5C6ERJ4_9BACT|nr:beta-ketoacyl synthase N-terminal-like domain-containing protein [Rubripirellula tenax]TWU50930.1 3-oxoacyl-[acyl-carrier-protein] synthase 2 [Rubripirellula tenax]